jgi:hypothetical protein
MHGSLLQAVENGKRLERLHGEMSVVDFLRGLRCPGDGIGLKIVVHLPVLDVIVANSSIAAVAVSGPDLVCFRPERTCSVGENHRVTDQLGRVVLTGSERREGRIEASSIHQNPHLAEQRDDTP